MSAPVLDTWFEDGEASTFGPMNIVSSTATNKGGPGNGTVQNVAGRVMIVFVGSNDNTLAPSVTWDGNALSAIGSRVDSPGAFSVWMFGLKGDGVVSAGSKVLSVSFTGQPSVAISAYVFNGCDTTTGWNSNVSNSGTGTGATSGAITSTTNDYCVGGITDENNNGVGFGGTSGTTADNREGRFNGNYTICREVGASSVTMDVTLGTSSVGWAMLAVNILGSSSAPPAGGGLLLLGAGG